MDIFVLPLFFFFLSYFRCKVVLFIWDVFCSLRYTFIATKGLNTTFPASQRFWYVVFSFLFVFRWYFISPLISLLTQKLFGRMWFSHHLFVPCALGKNVYSAWQADSLPLHHLGSLSVATPAFFGLPFAWSILFYLFTFSLCLSLELRCVFWRQAYIWVLFFNPASHSVSVNGRIQSVYITGDHW